MLKQVSGLVLSVWVLGCTDAGMLAPEAAAPEVGTIQQAATSTRSMMNGYMVSAQAYEEGGGRSVEAWQVSTNGVPASFLSLWSYSVDPSSYTCHTEVCWAKGSPTPTDCSWCYYTRTFQTYGYGQIPAGSLEVQGGVARLSVDLSTVSNFFYESCTINEGSPSNCIYSPAVGTVSGLWKRDGKGSTFHSGVEEDRWGKYAFRSTGNFRTNSATVTGSVLGIPLAGSRGNIGSGIQVMMDLVPAAP